MKSILRVALALVAASAAAEPTPFFREYCLRCHDAKKQKGDLRLDNVSREFGDQFVAQTWDEILFRINSGEMPPEDEKQPSAKELGEAVEWIAARIDEGRAERMARRSPVALYRLSRQEYANTVGDLLGVHFDVDAPGAFNEDPRWHGFERIGSQLSLSPSHVDRYFEAAQLIVNEAFPERPDQPTSGRVEANDKRATEWREDNGVEDPVRMLLLPGVKSSGAIDARRSGLYRIRIQLSGLPSFKGRLPHLTIWDDKVKRSLFGRDVIAPEDKPAVIEIETWLPAGRHQLMNEAPGTFEALTLSLTRSAPFTKTSERRFTHPASYKLYNQSDEPIFPLLIVDWFEWEGPVTAEADLAKRERLYPASEDSGEVRASLQRFIERAWRRPATQADLDRLFAVFEGEVAAGEDFRSAYLGSLIAALTSKNFYYLAEGSAKENRPHLNDWELASRLSYFLWGSMPDEVLSAVAREGKLGDLDELNRQVSRMLADPKTERFLDAFPRQWLQLHRVGQFPPDRELYPDYDNWLEQSMIRESTEFFSEVFRQNLSIRDFLDADWTMVNARLAMHYGYPKLDQPGFQRVSLERGDQRGGLLTQASVLSLTSDGTRHRPVHRGVWVWESVFGQSPPPPPPNVEPLEPTPSDQPKATIRMQLAAHATHSTCASCHRKIDPLGFAFDNFDAIGRWRTQEVVEGGQGDNPRVNASGMLPDGRQFDGPAGFKALLTEDTEQFAEAMAGQLATFALRRVMTIDDQAELRAIAKASAEDDYRLRSLVEHLVRSELFRRR